MPKKKLSKQAKRRVLLANKSRLERDLAKVSSQLEQCLSCDADKLRRDLARLDQQAERERARVVSRLGLRPEEAAELLQPAARKASKKIPRGALARGAAMEAAEHGLDPALAAKIASDHLRTDPTFYSGKKTAKKASKKAGKRKSKKTEGSRAKMIANRRAGSQDFAERMRAAKAAKKAGKKSTNKRAKKGK